MGRPVAKLGLAAALLGFAIWHTAAFAEPMAVEIEAEDLGWVSAAKAKSAQVDHTLRNGVHERCWLSSADARAAIEQVLIRRGIRVASEDEQARPDLLVALEISGHEISETYCVIVVRADVLLYEASEQTEGAFPMVSSAWRVLWSDMALLSGPRDGMNERVRREAVGLLDAFATTRIRRIERIAKKLMEQKGPEAVERWRAYLAE